MLLPQVKALCAQGCMVPIIDLIHSCLKQVKFLTFGVYIVSLIELVKSSHHRNVNDLVLTIVSIL